MTVGVTVQPRAAAGDPDPAAAEYTFKLGTADPVTKLLPVQSADPGRVTKVDAAALTLADRPALAYRGRRLFDAPELAVTSVAVSPAAGEAFAVAATPKVAPAAGVEWALTAPAKLPAAAAKAAALADGLARAEAVEYVADDPPAADLDTKYGLAKPRFTVKLDLAGVGPRTLAVGAVRPGKADVFARVDGGPVFALAQSAVDPLAAGPLALLSPDVWAVPGRVTAIEVNRAGQEAYTLAKSPAGWVVRGPFDAPVAAAAADALAAAVAAVTADKFVAFNAADPAKFGFTPPKLTLTLTLADGTPAGPLKLVVGSPDGVGFHARAEGPGVTPAVFVVPAALVNLADKPALDWPDKTLLAADPQRVTKLTLTAGTDPAVTLTKADGKWTAAGFPVDQPTAGALAAAVARPRVDKLAGYGAGVKWADFGLAAPAATLTVDLDSPPPEAAAKHTLKLGKPTPDGGRFVRVDDGPAVGVVSAVAARVLAGGKLDVIDKALFAFDPAKLTTLTRVAGKETLAVTRGRRRVGGDDARETEGGHADAGRVGRPAGDTARGPGGGVRPG